MSGAAACLTVALVAVVMVMVSTGGDDASRLPTVPIRMSAPTTEANIQRVAATSKSAAAMVSSIRPSTVLLRVLRRVGISTSIGVVAESGGILVTPWTAVSGARSVTAVEPNGTRSAATLVGVDHASGLAVLQISDDLPAATFDVVDPIAGSTAFAVSLALTGHGGVKPSPEVYAGNVLSAGQSISGVSTGQASPGATTSSFAVTEVQAPLTNNDVGCPLLDSQGNVVGLLDQTSGTGTSRLSIFLPAALVEGVARQLVSAGTVQSGWLGTTVSNGGTTNVGATAGQPAATGARLVSVVGNSPADQAGLRPGDVITAVGGAPVRSAAELETQLYADPPGTTVDLTVNRNGVTLTVPVDLGQPGGAAPVDTSSP
ncbi:MAG: S1C family serine protease [Acidimicrobiales bacterium]